MLIINARNTDCDSSSLVLRLPYELVVEILKSLPSVEGRDELFEKVKRAATRSNKLTALLRGVQCND